MMMNAVKKASLIEGQVYRIYSIMVDRNFKVLSESENKPLKSHPVQAKWAKMINRERKIYLHSEMRTMINNNEKGSEKYLFVARVGVNGEIRMARPCEICSAAIFHDTNLDTIVYTDNNGQFVEEPIQNFKPN